MAKLLILSSDTGEGHNSTGAAILDAASASGLDASLRKPAEESGALNRTLGKIYNAVLRHRPGWMAGYFRIVNRFRPNEAEWMYSAHRHFIARFLQVEKPDVVLSVHPMLNHLLQRYIKEQRITIPCYTLLTDPFPPFWQGWASPWVDRYFAPTTEAADALGQMGVAAGKIDIVPLPVRRTFVPHSEQARRSIREEFGVPGSEMILINGGARGGGPLLEIYRTVRTAAPDAGILMVCGHNNKLRDRIDRLANRRTRTFGFVTDIHRHIAAADLVLTKPGALSTCEALASKVPVLLLGVEGGLMPQESGMFHAAMKYGFALTAANLEGLSKVIAGGPQYWRQAASPAETFCSPLAAQELIERIHPHHVHV